MSSIITDPTPDALNCRRRRSLVSPRYCDHCWVTAHGMQDEASRGWDCLPGHKRRLATLGLVPTVTNVEIIHTIGTTTGARQRRAEESLQRAIRINGGV